MSPREYERVQWAAWKKAEQDEKNLIKIGWYTAALTRQERLQSLRTLLNPARSLTGEELVAAQAEFARLMEEMGN